MTRSVLFFVLVGLGCATTNESAPASRPATTHEAPADKIAASVLGHHGSLEEVLSAGFTFVVEVDGAEKARRVHRANFDEGWVEVIHEGATVRVQMADAETLNAAAGAEEPSPEGKAWGMWVNDWFWLTAASKLFDDGVARALTDSGALEVRYGSGGVTPGDTYRFVVEEGRVTAWSYTLGSGNEGAYAWKDEQRVGPLRLSLRREAEGRDVVIRFEAVEVVGRPLSLTLLKK